VEHVPPGYGVRKKAEITFQSFQIYLNHYSQIWHVFTIGMSREGAKTTSSNLLSSPRKGGLVWSHPTQIPSPSE